MGAYPFADLELAQRLERAEARASVESVKARASLWPESGATWMETAGIFAMFDGPASPLTQTFGLGVLGEPAPTDLDTVERFFEGRGAPVLHEVSPLALPHTLEALCERGFVPFEYTSVMFRPLNADVAPAAGGDAVSVRVATPAEGERWADTAAAGWSHVPGLEGFMRDLGRLTMSRAGSIAFFAEIDGEPVATGSLCIDAGVALLAGASTLPAWRNRGAQNALLAARMQFAVEQGCDLAMMCAAPGSASQRNAERHGFRIAYTRLKWRRGTR